MKREGKGPEDYWLALRKDGIDEVNERGVKGNQRKREMFMSVHVYLYQRSTSFTHKETLFFSNPKYLTTFQ